MNATSSRAGLGWSARLLIALVLILVGAAASVWALAHYPPAARYLGVAQPPPVAPPAHHLAVRAPAPVTAPDPKDSARDSALETRLARLESTTAQVRGSAGRADALVVAFAARRAIDRGVSLGYLEGLLVDRFGAQHQGAVATIVTAARRPVRLDDLISQYQALAPDLRRGGARDSWWDGVRSSLSSLVEVHRTGRPPANADARYARALQHMESGDVDRALAETMRLPGAASAAGWTEQARRYVAAHRALDEIETGALLIPQNPVR